MKCLSLRQPFATLVILGIKRIETRSRPTAHRGPLAIHASRRFDPRTRSLCEQGPFRAVLDRAGYRTADQLPLGALLGTVEVTDCRPTEEWDVDPTSDEATFGDFSPGRWGWQFADPSRLLVPLPCKGQLGLFDIPQRFRRGCLGLMAEQQWATETDPERLFEVLGDTASDRKLRLFAVACYHRLWHLLGDDGRRCVEMAERLAEVSPGEAGGRRSAPQAVETDEDGDRARPLLAADAFGAATYASDDTLEAYERYCAVQKMGVAGIDAFRRMERRAQADLLRDVVGNPFRPPRPIAPAVLAWNECTVRRIAEGIYEDRAFDRLPILADALLDAGCDDEELIGHCRSGGEHVRGCWALDLLLTKA